MAFDEGLAQILRDALVHEDGVSEKKMFGGLCFLLNGNMLCGVSKVGGMARVGKDNEPRALQIPGVTPLSFTGRKMGGMVDLASDTVTDDDLRDQVLSLAIEFVQSLPPK